MAVEGRSEEGVEIWDIKSKQPFKVLETGNVMNKYIPATNNILAVTLKLAPKTEA